MISWDTNDPLERRCASQLRPVTNSLLVEGDLEVENFLDQGFTGMSFAFMREASPMPMASVKVTRDIDSAEAVLRQIADEVKRGNIDADYQALSRQLSLACADRKVSGGFSDLGATWFSRDTGAFLPANSRHSELA